MAKTIVFKKKFEDKLKKFKIKTIFVQNIKAQCKSGQVTDQINRLNRLSRWNDFIDYAFVWEFSRSKNKAHPDAYWRNIASK